MRDISTKFPEDFLSAAEYNSSQVELENIVTSAGLTLDDPGGPDDNQNQLGQAAAAYSCGGDVFEAGGTVNDIFLTVTSNLKPPAQYIDKMRLSFKPTGTNTGAVTVNLNGIGVKKVFDEDGNDLPAGRIIPGMFMEVVYDTTLDVSGAFEYVPQLSDSRLQVTYRIAQGTAGGNYTPNSWNNIRPMNTIELDEIGGIVAPTSPDYELTLPRGVYDFSLVLYGTGLAQTAARIYNVTDATVIYERPMVYIQNDGQKNCDLRGRIELTSPKALRVEIYGKSTAGGTNSMGEPMNIPGLDEIYLDWIITRKNFLTP